MPEHEEDYEERRREMEAGAREMEERREEFGRVVDEAESDWEGKKSDESVEGAQEPEHKLVVDDEVKERVLAEQDQEEEADGDEAGAEGDPEREGVEDGAEAQAGDEDAGQEGDAEEGDAEEGDEEGEEGTS